MRDKLKMSLPLVDSLRTWAGPDATERERALARALDEHWTSLCEAVYYLVGDWEDAQDLALEAFWRLHTRAPNDVNDLANAGGGGPMRRPPGPSGSNAPPRSIPRTRSSGARLKRGCGTSCRI